MTPRTIAITVALAAIAVAIPAAVYAVAHHNTASAVATSSAAPTGDPHAYARAFIGPAADLRESWTHRQEACDAGVEFACGVGSLNVATTAGTLTTELDTWADQSNAHHIVPLHGGDGERLLTETTADAKALQTAAQAYSDALCNPVAPEKHVPECLTMQGDLENAWAKLDADLTTWERYR